MDKVQMKKVKADHVFHVALLTREGMTKATALLVAYAEGQSGLDRRLGQQALIPRFEDVSKGPGLSLKSA